MTEMLRAAVWYADTKNFATFPLRGIGPTTKSCTCGDPKCASPGKHPWTINGLKSATTNRDTLQGLFTGKQDANIAIATGPISGIFVLDIDGALGESSLAQYPPLPDTLTSTTGRGRHLIFLYPPAPRKVHTRAGKFAPGLDIRGEGGYIVAPPSRHILGTEYQWLDDQQQIAQAPEWLLDIICREHMPVPIPSTQPQQTTPTRYDQGQWTLDQVRQMLGHIDPDCGYDEWIEIGMGLQAESIPLPIWDEWSRKGSKYQPGCCTSHWKSFSPERGISFGTIVHRAQQGGWHPETDEAPISLENHPAREFLLSLRMDKTTPSKEDTHPTPHFNPIDLPGLIGDTVREIIQTAQKPQPELALLNTLTALGAIFGRRYATPMDTRTNIYAVGLAGTGKGKDHSRRFVKRLMAEAGLSTFLGEDTIISGAGLLTSIENRPAQIMHLDEFGMLLEAITDTRGAHYMKAASKIITEMYSTSSGPYAGGQYADRKTKPVTIQSPNLCIYGTTTPEKYISGLSRSAVTSGELNRFIVLRPHVEHPKRRRFMGAARPSSGLVQQWQELSGPTIPLNNSIITPEPMTVSWADVEDRIWEIALYEDAMIEGDGETGPLWGRYRENVIKISMIFAIARNPMVPVIINSDLDYAEALVRQAIEYASSLARDHMSESEHEKDCQEIIRIIQSHDGRLKKSDLYNRTRRMDNKQRENAIRSLTEMEKVYIETLQGETGGRPSVFYVIK